MTRSDTKLKPGDARFAATVMIAHEKADPLIAIELRLSDLVSILRTVVIALNNPNIGDIWAISDCADVLEFATREIDLVRERASEQATEFLREAT